jgi:hypothetical protein
MAKNDKAGKVDFEFGVRFGHSFKDGKVEHYEKGAKVSLNRPAAEKFAKMGLGKIVAETAPVELQAPTQ